MPFALRGFCLLGLLLAAAGCQQGAPWAATPNAAQNGQMVAQMQALQTRAAQLDTNNRDLHRQLAEARQQSQLLQDRVTLLGKQLTDATEKLSSANVARLQADKRVEAINASTRLRGGATITANNSLKSSLQAVQIPGVEVRPDGDVLRIEIQTERLFLPGTATLHQGAYAVLDQVGGALARNYPRQIIAIEGHSDSDPIASPQFRSQHQLTIAQSQAVFDVLVQRSRLSAQRLVVLGHGPNHPIVSNGTAEGKARNRRIELVIYPDTKD